MTDNFVRLIRQGMSPADARQVESIFQCMQDHGLVPYGAVPFLLYEKEQRSLIVPIKRDASEEKAKSLLARLAHRKP